MRLCSGVFVKEANISNNLSHPRLYELVEEHNNKVGLLVISYTLCKHYYDQGIPDEPWYISPGKMGNQFNIFRNLKRNIG